MRGFFMTGDGDFIYAVKYSPATVSCPICEAKNDKLYELTASKDDKGVWFLCLDVSEGKGNCPQFYVSFE